ncbi:MAG: hypothetical protein MHM6MM_008233 [Cercozoa sp. M6MM]
MSEKEAPVVPLPCGGSHSDHNNNNNNNNNCRTESRQEQQHETQRDDAMRDDGETPVKPVLDLGNPSPAASRPIAIPGAGHHHTHTPVDVIVDEDAALETPPRRQPPSISVDVSLARLRSPSDAMLSPVSGRV